MLFACCYGICIPQFKHRIREDAVDHNLAHFTEAVLHHPITAVQAPESSLKNACVWMYAWLRFSSQALDELLLLDQIMRTNILPSTGSNSAKSIVLSK